MITMSKNIGGIIYILTNPSFPDWIKIGRCSNLERRISSLSNNTCLPFPFECFYACRVKDPSKVESTLHFIFNQFRLSSKREFFDIDPEQVIAALSLLPDIIEIPPPNTYEKTDQKSVLEREIERQSQFRFNHASIPLGEEIYLTRLPEIKATVINDTHVELDGAIISLINATNLCLKKHLGADKARISSPRYWSYEGEMLVKRKHRLAG